MSNKLNVAIVGYGYWGPNLARNVELSLGLELVCICDFSTEILNRAFINHPKAKTVTSIEDALNLKNLDAVIIATPPSTHFALGMKALKKGKHVLIEKPLAQTSEECRLLIDEAQSRNLILMVDHTFAYTGAVKKMNELAESSLGDLLYYDSVRINLGLFQRDVNVMWDLAVHDLSILDLITGFAPKAVSATGLAHVDGYPTNTAYLTLYYQKSFIAHIHCSWMAPVKIRQTLLGGSSKMIVYDDLEPTEKIKVYDKGISLNPTDEEKYDMRVDYRTADMYSPKINSTEALAMLVQEFAECVFSNRRPLTDATSGLRVVSILEAADISLSEGGAPVSVKID